MKAGRGDDEVVMSHQGVELRDRGEDLGAHATVGFLRQRELRHDAFGRNVLEQRLTSRQPGEMRSKARHDSDAPRCDLVPEVRPQRTGARRPKDVTRSPGLAGHVIWIRRERLAFAG